MTYRVALPSCENPSISGNERYLTHKFASLFILIATVWEHERVENAGITNSVLSTLTCAREMLDLFDFGGEIKGILCIRPINRTKRRFLWSWSLFLRHSSLEIKCLITYLTLSVLQLIPFWSFCHWWQVFMLRSKEIDILEIAHLHMQGLDRLFSRRSGDKIILGKARKSLSSNYGISDNGWELRQKTSVEAAHKNIPCRILYTYCKNPHVPRGWCRNRRQIELVSLVCGK